MQLCLSARNVPATRSLHANVNATYLHSILVRFPVFQEFSLAREQREEEDERERLLKEKGDAKERNKQARIDKFARRMAKRRNLPRDAESNPPGNYWFDVA